MAEASMTSSHVRAARVLRAEYRMTVEELATMYRVSRSCMSSALRGKTYPDAGGPLDSGRNPPGTWTGKKRPHRRACLCQARSPACYGVTLGS
jgi:hypothetical protein